MRIRAKIKGIGQQVEGFLIECGGEPKIFCEVKNYFSLDKRKPCIYGIYLDSIEFWIQGRWCKFIEGMGLLIECYGEASVPTGIFNYFKDKVQGQAKEADN